MAKYDFFAFTGNDCVPKFCINLKSFGGITKAYNQCSPVSTIINRNAIAMANGIWYIVDETDTDVSKEYPHLKTLLQNPNPLQSWTEFLIQLDVFRQLYGEVFVYGVEKVGFEKQALFVLNPEYVKLKNNKIDFFRKKEEIITSYTFVGENLTVENVLHIKDIYQNIDLKIPLRGKSRLTSLEYEVKNVMQAQEAIYSLNQDRGALGILTNKGKDADGSTPMKKSEKENVQKQLISCYGLSERQAKVIVTDADLDWQAMTFNVKDLMLYEGIKQNIETIADAFNYPFELLANSKGTTYNNKNEAKKSLYQDGVIPISNIYEQLFGEFFQLKDGHKIDIDFSHIECLQEAVKERAEAKLKINTGCQIAFRNGIITINEWREQLELDRLDDGDKYYEDENNKNSQQRGNGEN